MTAYKWDAAEYARSSTGQLGWARELIAKLDLQGGERILDIGCGDGKVSAELASGLATGSVLGVDNSPEMVALAETVFPPMKHPNLRFRLADAVALPFRNEFDVVFSNATLHWVLDHAPVLEGIAGSLKPGGRILIQMGGRGNAAAVVAASDIVRARPEWRDSFAGFQFPYGFYGPEEYRDWLEAAGLVPLRVELLQKDMAHKDRTAFEGWLRTTWLPYTQRIAEERREAFVQQVADQYLDDNPASPDGVVHLAMVRLEVEAKKES
ncbi:MAG TPA: methyltransferase domain-containing protein [Anaerolineales bacterium]|nr:methyltransferase domain-containing protein [Anaerolineales bacterium]